MRTSYMTLLPETDPAFPAACTIDLMELPQPEYPFMSPTERRVFLVPRVFTPPRLRGRGLARSTWRQVLRDADYEGVELVLWINPYGDMTYDQLRDWYLRLGFHPERVQSHTGERGELFRRIPQ